MDEGVGQQKSSTGKKPQQIETYLKNVGKNLKGFTTEAKNSIIIEIEEHILEKIEDGEKGEGGREGNSDKENAEERGAIIRKVLDEYGDPKTVAQGYSPIIRLSSRNRRLFQAYSLLISLTFLYVAVPQFLYPIKDFNEIQGYQILGIIVGILAYICIFFNLIYVSKSEKLVKYSNVSLISNTILGMAFLLLIFNGYLGFLNAPVIDYYDMKDAEITEDPLFFGVLITCLGVISFHISHLGHSMMTQDTADGIAPLKNISSRLFPILFVINFLSLFVVIGEMWDTFEYISEWNTTISYFVLILLLFLTISIGLVLLLQSKSGVKNIHIQREVFVFMIVCLILTSSIAGGFILEDIDMQDEWEDKDYSPKNEDYMKFKNISQGLFNNGSMYTRDLITNEDNYTFILYQWDSSLNGINRTIVIPIIIDPSGYSNAGFRNIRTSGYFIHAWMGLTRSIQDDENKTEEKITDNYYLLMTFDGILVNATPFDREKDYWYYLGNLLVDGPNATLVFNKFIENETEARNMNWSEMEYPSHRKYDYLNVSLHSFSNGNPIGLDQVNVTIPLSNTVSWSKSHPQIWYLPGNGNVSVGFTFRQYVDPNIFDMTYLIKISLDGTIQIPPFLLTNSTHISSGSYDVYGNSSVSYVLYGYENYFLMGYNEYNDETYVTGVFSYQITYNQTTDDFELIRNDFIVYDDPSFRAYNQFTFDGNGMSRFSLLNARMNNSEKRIIATDFLVDSKGVILEVEERSLNGISIFRKYENMGDGFDDLLLWIISEGYFTDGNTTYEFFYLRVREQINDVSRGMSYQIILIKNDDNFTYYEYGDDIQPMETKNAYFMALIIGFSFGVAIPGYFWWLLKKRSNSENR